MDAFAATALALTATSASFIAVLIARRLILARQEQQREALEQRLRPIAITLIEADEEPDRLEDREAQVLAAILTRYARQLDGEARQRIADFFERSGHVSGEISRLGDSRPWRRATAAYVLGDMGSRKAVPPLESALGDEERDVRAAAALSLGKLRAEQAVEPLVGALASGRVPRSVGAQALLLIGPAAVPGLKGLVASPDAAVRTAAIGLIGLLGSAEDSSTVLAGLRDTSADVRAKAAFALGRLGAAEATSALRAALGDRLPSVRVAVAQALGSIGDRNAVPPLIEQATRDRFEPAQAAAAALARIDPDALRQACERYGGAHLCEAADMVAVQTADMVAVQAAA
jgi:HEAT repeat protein